MFEGHARFSSPNGNGSKVLYTTRRVVMKLTSAHTASTSAGDRVYCRSDEEVEFTFPAFPASAPEKEKIEEGITQCTYGQTASWVLVGWMEPRLLAASTPLLCCSRCYRSQILRLPTAHGTSKNIGFDNFAVAYHRFGSLDFEHTIA